ncbi:hypothetical protein [Prosthecobacter fluviatilis]|uniref:DUF4398 domain-containing protein n=1 Tax=Prosthecobacter fluviatilis TaxID=445931 RepID=A0ABW0KU26_9BACT
MKSPIAHRFLSLSCVLSLVLSCVGRGADPEAAAFKSPAALRAQTRYQQSSVAAAKRLTDELDRTLAYAVKAGALEEANQITEAKKQVAAGGAVIIDFKRQNLVTARNMYSDAIAHAKGQYFRDLEPALREATKAGDLPEANAIDAERKALESELADGKVTGKIENGLLLTIGGKRSVWDNKPITLPEKKTTVTLTGVLLLTGKVRTVKLRTAKANGSERLRFTVDGKVCDFHKEGSNHRYVIVTPQPGSDKLRLRLGDSIAANEWEFGPLEWSINDGQWREIPRRSMVAVD